MEETWFLATMEYSPNGKGIMAPTECTPMVYNYNEKSMVL